jgi:predicted acetylornithine/succinylornithine family transaminase
MTTAAASSAEIIDLYRDYVVGNYTRYPVCLVRGEGSWVWDAEGNRYLDFFPGWGCGLVGHCPPRVVEAVREQVATLIHVPNTWYTDAQGQLAKALCERLDFPAKAFFCNSGTEANEAAIKLARLWGGSAGKFKVLTFSDSFHGRTFGSLSATAQPKYHAGLGPMLPGFVYAPFGDLAAAEKAVDDETAAVLLEPIQGEGGVNLPPAGFLEGLRNLCDRRGMLLMFDEVQTGMGRTGKWFAFQHTGISPDVMTLAKGLGNGVPIGACLARGAAADVFSPGKHGSTFGGNPLCCAASLATLEAIEAEGLMENASRVGGLIRAELSQRLAGEPGVKQIRGKGLMIGIELDRPCGDLVKRGLEAGLLINVTADTVVRLLPPLILRNGEAQMLVERLAELIRSFLHIESPAAVAG